MVKNIVIFDGAMGTNLPRGFSCSEAYNLSSPDAVRDVHRSFISAGCNVIETNTFNGNRVSLKEFGLENKVAEINKKAVAIAREAVAGAGREIKVSGCIGPMNKLPTLGQISFDQMHDAYVEQIGNLLVAGVDMIQADTCQDLLQAKIAAIAANDSFEKAGRRVPLIISVTIDQTGKMLLGTEIDAVLATLLPLGISAIGLNCGVGPKAMEGAVRYLSHHSTVPILVMPNAGMPEISDGKTSYGLAPDDFAEQVKFFVEELGVEMVGGCCGTKEEHIRALAGAVGKVKPAKRKAVFRPALSSLFCATDIRQEPRPFIIGERMNVTGSKKFKEALLANDFDATAALARVQEEEGAHALDVSVSYAGRDEPADIKEVISRVVQIARLPICIDSTNPSAIEAALKLIPGRPIINSINLEDGGAKAEKILGLAKKFGAAVVALTIDEKGMAKTSGDKLKITSRLIKLCASFGIMPCDIFLDALTFTLAEPNAASFGSAKETLKAVKDIKKKFPDVNTSLGVSNVSYGFLPPARKILNSVLLHEALQKGLDAAIIHAGRVVPLSMADKAEVGVALDLVLNKKKDALERFVGFFEGRKAGPVEVSKTVNPSDGIRLCVLNGDRARIEEFLAKIIDKKSPRDILNDLLLPAMGEVGKLFEKGETPLPYVLQSAEVMRKATDWLAPRFEKGTAAKRGKILLATVKGDVHDIGKNLVDIILTNNGFEVINIGVKQSIENILKAISDSKPDVIGLSGLLVESALIMKDDLLEAAHSGVKIPVVCGGAALTKKYVEEDLSRAYGRKVHYAKDAFDGLKIIEKIVAK
jgi:5-methyltetrahydrofolate--homocysteine methyltransferase